MENASSATPVDCIVMHRRIETARLWAEQESRPFVELIVSVRNRERPTMLISKDGFEVVDDGLCEADSKIIAQCQEWIQYIHQRAIKMAYA
jgi:hypothetical protein